MDELSNVFTVTVKIRYMDSQIQQVPLVGEERETRLFPLPRPGHLRKIGYLGLPVQTSVDDFDWSKSVIPMQNKNSCWIDSIVVLGRALSLGLLVMDQLSPRAVDDLPREARLAYDLFRKPFSLMTPEELCGEIDKLRRPLQELDDAPIYGFGSATQAWVKLTARLPQTTFTTCTILRCSGCLAVAKHPFPRVKQRNNVSIPVTLLPKALEDAAGTKTVSDYRATVQGQDAKVSSAAPDDELAPLDTLMQIHFTSGVTDATHGVSRCVCGGDWIALNMCVLDRLPHRLALTDSYSRSECNKDRQRDDTKDVRFTYFDRNGKSCLAHYTPTAFVIFSKAQEHFTTLVKTYRRDGSWYWVYFDGMASPRALELTVERGNRLANQCWQMMVMTRVYVPEGSTLL